MTKKLFRFFVGAALAGVAALACSREAMDPAEKVNSGTTRTVVFRAMGSQTKAQFGQKEGDTWPTLWTSNDSEVKLSLNYGSATAAAVTPSDDWRSATFSTTIDFSEFSAPYTYYSVSPSSVAKALSPSREAWKVSIPSVQTPSAGSPDESALIIASTSDTYQDADAASDVNLYFNHLTAYGCISLTGLDLTGKTVQAVELTATEPFVGDWYWKCESHELIDYGASSTLTINTNHPDNVWFGCAPVDMSNQVWEVSLITDAGTYSKSILFDGDNYQLQPGIVAEISVDMSTDDVEFTAAGSSGSGSGSGAFELVTDASTLVVGDEVLIVYTAGGLALGGLNSSGNFRDPVEVTISNNAIASAGTATILTLEAGNSSGTWAFKDGNVYLASAASSNYLKNSSTKNANASWAISINSSNGQASVVAQAGSSTILSYNTGSPRFSCYGNTNQKAVSIYRRTSSGGVSADNPLLGETNYGCYLGTGLEWQYNPGTDQVTRSYDEYGFETYTLINPSTVEELEITGYKKGYIKGDGNISISVKWRRGTSTVLTQNYSMKIIKEDGPKVWLSDGTHGVIIKK